MKNRARPMRFTERTRLFTERRLTLLSILSKLVAFTEDGTFSMTIKRIVDEGCAIWAKTQHSTRYSYCWPFMRWRAVGRAQMSLRHPAQAGIRRCASEAAEILSLIRFLRCCLLLVAQAFSMSLCLCILLFTILDLALVFAT